VAVQTHESFGRTAGIATYLNMVYETSELKDFPVAHIARKAARKAIEDSHQLYVKRLNVAAVAGAIIIGITECTFNQFNSELRWDERDF
jgi:nickel-dependent lactate racemase